jgi:single-strand DNA-binding protein
MYQKLVIVGRVGKQPEMRFTPNGVPVTNFPVAVNNNYTRSDGTKVQETTWFRVSAWRGTAEACGEYLEKGQMVIVEGKMTGDRESGGDGDVTIRARAWMGQDGEPRSSFEIDAQRVQFGPRAGGGGGPAPLDSAPAPYDGKEEEEIPF